MEKEIIFAILKKVSGNLHFTKDTKGDFLVCDPEEFKISVLKKTRANLILENKMFQKYSTDEVEAAFTKALDEWSQEFKRQTVYMK